MLRSCLLATACLFVSLNTLAAQTPNPPAVPAATDPSAPEKMEEVQVGDHWTYEFRDDISGDVKSVLTDTVTDLTDSQIGISVTRAGNTSSGYQTYDRSWNLVKSGAHRYSPSDGTGVQAQLATGKVWSIKSNDINGGFSARRSVTSKVIAQESVTTPAGTFETFKIETSIQIQNSNNATDKAQAVISTWYAPAIDHWVKRTILARQRGHVVSKNTVELTDYSRGKQQ